MTINNNIELFHIIIKNVFNFNFFLSPINFLKIFFYIISKIIFIFKYTSFYLIY